MSDGQLIEFSKHFGTLDLAATTTSGEREIPEHPEINVISNVVDGGRPIGSLGALEAEWHTDMSYVDSPPKMSCLYALEVPPAGGNTSFVNMYLAYEELSDDLKVVINGKYCKHDASRNSAGELRKGYEHIEDVRAIPGTLHPLVIRHPETARAALYLGRRRNAYIDGLPVDESNELLDKLWKHAIRPEYRWDQVWNKGDVVLWDNRCTMHRRDSFDTGYRRIMHRTQVQGGPVVGAHVS